MTKIAKKILKIFLLNGITITVKYLPSALNKLADQQSQHRTKNSE